jgi:CheY-like chemotaxis protein
LTAVDGPGGIQQVADASRLDLLITDIGLPGLDGPELAARACKLYPDLSVLFMTGYLQDPSGNPVLRGPGMDYIIKPFTLEALATRVRHMLAEHNRLHSPHIPTSAS